MKPDYGWQRFVTSDALSWIKTAGVGDRVCYVSPTGSGKSFIELAILDSLNDWVIVSPKHEIIDGMLRKIGAKNVHKIDEATRYQLGFSTPLFLRNRLIEGLYSPPAGVIFDEAHHLLAETWQDLWLLCGQCPIIGFSASPFGGTPQRTKEFREFFKDNIKIVMNYPQAARMGLISVPQVINFPLLDDDTVEIVKGEFNVNSLVSQYKSQLIHVSELLHSYWDKTKETYDKATIISFPQVEFMKNFCSIASQVMRIPINTIDAKTSYKERIELFKHVVNRKTILAQVNVIGEGIDLPIERLVDLSPTMSPVKFLQLLGRIMRPGLNNEYIMTNRNLLRHGYLFEGAFPLEVMRKVQLAFPPSERMGVRIVGLEGIGKFKPTEIVFADGMRGLMYSLSKMDGFRRTDYGIIVHPLRKPIWAKKESIVDNDGKLKWGPWKAIEPIYSLEKGYASLPPAPITERQNDFWLSAAEEYGLDVAETPSKKSFQALPILVDLGIKFLGRKKS